MNKLNTKSIQKKLFGYGGELKNLMIKDFKRKKEILKKLVDYPRLNLNPRQLCDLELLMNGGFSPLEGFMDKENYESVVKNMRLKNGTLWTIPIVLDFQDPGNYKVGSEIMLCDEYGKPLALFTVTSIYQPNKNLELEYVYGTTDTSHFGVNQIVNYTGNYYFGGKIEGIATVDRIDFTEYRYTPVQLRKLFAEKNWAKVIGFQTRNPLHKAHYAMIKRAAEENDAIVLLHPTVGVTKDEDIDYIIRTKCYIALYNNYINSFAFLSLLPLAMRMAGPREAILHAIIRKNYGCTHFIVGRDHAGPKNADGIPFYRPYQAQELIKKYAVEIGIIPILFNEMVYIENERIYIPMNEVKSNQTFKNISGNEFRRMIYNDEKIPDWFSFPEIIFEIKKGLERQLKDGLTIFFTGLPCAGKSTIARYLYFRLLEIQNKNITLLDGDVVRQNLSKGLGFSKEDRNINITRIGFVASEITKHRGIAICSAVAPYEKTRQKNRALINKYGHYIEVYVATSPEVCVHRDIKGLYKMAKTGKLINMTGINDPYEPPTNPEITLKTENKSPTDCAKDIIEYLIEKNLIHLGRSPVREPGGVSGS